MDTHRVASADGTSIAYRLSGDGDPVLLVHGTATSGADWVPVLPFLRERFAPVTMDRRGRGRSADGVTYAIEREVEDLAAVMAATSARHVVAHSYGALCAIQAAASGVPMDALVVYEPPIGPRRAGAAAGVDAGEPDAAVIRFLLDIDVTAEEVDVIRASPAWPILCDAAPTIPRELDAQARWERPAGPVDVPTLLLVGEDTRAPVFLDGLDSLAAAFPAHRHQRLPGQRHLAHVQTPEAFAAAVAAFLDG